MLHALNELASPLDLQPLNLHLPQDSLNKTSVHLPQDTCKAAKPGQEGSQGSGLCSSERFGLLWLSCSPGDCNSEQAEGPPALGPRHPLSLLLEKTVKHHGAVLGDSWDERCCWFSNAGTSFRSGAEALCLASCCDGLRGWGNALNKQVGSNGKHGGAITSFSSLSSQSV